MRVRACVCVCVCVCASCGPGVVLVQKLGFQQVLCRFNCPYLKMKLHTHNLDNKQLIQHGFNFDAENATHFGNSEEFLAFCSFIANAVAVAVGVNRITCSTVGVW